MHDWTLLSVVFEWKAGQATLSFRSDAGNKVLVARSVVELHVSQFKEWGPSVSVNEVKGPFATDKGLQSIEIEMQSGDIIKIIAASFEMPNSPDTS
jgi:hypothetical protein